MFGRRAPKDLPASRLCTHAQMTSDWHKQAAEALRESTTRMHRKIWEFTFVTATLDKLGLLREGTRGLGFAVGKEPLPSYFASRGCEIVASDLDFERAEEAGWATTDQHASQLEDLNQRGLCDPEAFANKVSFEVVDMNAIPDTLTGFDFTWSCCAFEHLGSIHQGSRFVRNQMKCLKPGGIAIHTTEFNLSSNDETIDHQGTVLFRKRDIQHTIKRLRQAGHDVYMDWDAGDGELDKVVDVPPYGQDNHLRLLIEKYTCTSIGLVVRKGR